MVATHDCDCVSSENVEPRLEIVLGREITKDELDGTLTLAKSTRKLHIEVTQHNKYIELSSTTKTSVDKLYLLRVEPLQDWKLNTEQRRIFRRWLGLRYDRVAFPEELVKRLKPIADDFKKVSKNDGATIIGIYIQFEPEHELESASTEPYAIKISVVYDSFRTDGKAAASRIASKLKARFQEVFNLNGHYWQSVELESCTVRSDIDFTLQEALSSYVLRLDELSLRVGAQGKMPPH